MRFNRPCVRAAALVAALLPTAALAQPLPVLDLDPGAGPPGATVTVSGSGFDGNCGVEVRWDTDSGALLASVAPESGSFSVPVTVPQETEVGMHTVIAVGLVLSGEFCADPGGPRAEAPFEVVPGGPGLDLDRRIYLKDRILDDPGIDDGFLGEVQAAAAPLHGLVQLQRLPSAGGTEIDDLRRIGVDLLDYLNGMEGPGTAYVALLDPGIDPADPVFVDLVRGLQPLVPADKLNHDLREDPAPTENDERAVVVRFFADVDGESAAGILDGAGVLTLTQLGPASWAVEATDDQIAALAAEDAVQYMESGPGPFEELVDEVRAGSGVDPLHDLDTGSGVYGGLSGDGVQIGIMDSGVDSDHVDFDGRVVRFDEPGGDHGTHVAGIAAGSGVQSDGVDDDGVSNDGSPFQWRGMAPEAELAAYGSIGGDTTQFDDAINGFGVDVSNHSYVTGAGVQCQYTSEAATLDSLIRGDTAGVPARPMVWAAGNNANVAPRDCDDDPGTPDEIRPQYPGACGSPFQAGYFSVFASCKNCIAVANVTKDLVHASSSSIGPTLDGRVKPDVSMIGTSVTATGADTDSDGDPTAGNGYRSKSGTSMASPGVAGVVALLLQQYAEQLGVDLDVSPPLPSTIKALLVQGADDLEGSDPAANFDTGSPVDYGPGPDWATGYGLVNAGASSSLLADERFLEGQVDAFDAEDELLAAVVPGQTELKVTLAWDDRAGSPSTNDAASQLVNDLDLTLEGPDAVERLPLVLPIPTPLDCDGDGTNGIQVGTCNGQDAAGQDYFGPASEGTDRRNNVEQVLVRDEAGLAPGNWTVRVSVLNVDATVRLPLGGGQPYSLAGVTGNRSDLAITKSDDVDPVAAGAELTYTVEVTNNGPDAALEVTVEDLLPDGVSHVSDTAGCALDGDDDLICSLGTIASGDSASFTITVQVDPALVFDAGGPTSLSNTAGAFSTTPDDDATDNEVDETTDVIAEADLEIVSFLAVNPPEEILIGEPVEVLLRKTVRNNGPSGPIDAMLTLDAVASAGAAVTPENQVIPVDALDVTESREVEETVTLTCEEFSNHSFTLMNSIAPANGEDLDPDPSNNAAEITLDVICVLPVTINIKPGSDPNSMHHDKTSTPLAVLTTSEDESRDLTGDRVVDGLDVIVLAANFGVAGDGMSADLDRNDLVDGNDLALLSSWYGKEAAETFDFDATTIDPLSVRYGPREIVFAETGGAFERHDRGHIEDSIELDEVTMDGDLDMVLHFLNQESGLEADDVEACVKGSFVDELGDQHKFFGCDAIRIVPGATAGPGDGDDGDCNGNNGNGQGQGNCNDQNGEEPGNGKGDGNGGG